MKILESAKKLLNFIPFEGFKRIRSIKPYKPPKSYSEILDRATKIINDKQLFLNDSLSMTWLSKEAGTNRTYLSRAFNEKGVSYRDFITKLRVEAAKSLIEKSVADNSPLSMEDLSLMSGFGSSRALGRHFKERMGITPAVYLKYLTAKKINPLLQSVPNEDSVL